MKKLLMILSIALVSVLLLGCQAQTGTTGGNTNAGNAGGKGTAVFTITDAAANMGSVSEVKVTVDSVKVHSQTEGGVTVSNQAQTYDLLELKAQGSQALLANAQLDAGTYDQLRMDISQVVVVDAEGQHEAKLPSNQLIINGNLEVSEGTTSTATFDFIADESLHVTGNGQFIMAPVIQLETRSNADVSVKSDSSVEVKGGSLTSNVKVGMDADGNIGVGLGIPANANVSIGGNGKISIGNGLGIGLGGQASGQAGGSADASAWSDSGATVVVGGSGSY